MKRYNASKGCKNESICWNLRWPQIQFTSILSYIIDFGVKKMINPQCIPKSVVCSICQLISFMTLFSPWVSVRALCLKDAKYGIHNHLAVTPPKKVERRMWQMVSWKLYWRISLIMMKNAAVKSWCAYGWQEGFMPGVSGLIITNISTCLKTF